LVLNFLNFVYYLFCCKSVIQISNKHKQNETDMKLRVKGVEDSSYDFTFDIDIKARGMCFNFKVEKAL